MVIVAHLGKGDTERERETERKEEGEKEKDNDESNWNRRASHVDFHLRAYPPPRQTSSPRPPNLSDRGSGSPNSWAELPSSSDCGGGRRGMSKEGRDRKRERKKEGDSSRG